MKLGNRQGWLSINVFWKEQADHSFLNECTHVGDQTAVKEAQTVSTDFAVDRDCGADSNSEFRLLPVSNIHVNRM